MASATISKCIQKDRWLTPKGEAPHVHGFRGSFSNWAGDHDLSFETSERCLGHAFGNTASQAYRTTDLIERRRTMLEAWSQFLEGGEK
jgi:integrase